LDAAHDVEHRFIEVVAECFAQLRGFRLDRAYHALIVWQIEPDN
jgi:hypothetical protein